MTSHVRDEVQAAETRPTCFGQYSTAWATCFPCPVKSRCEGEAREAEYRREVAVPEGAIVWAECEACEFPSTPRAIRSECPECYEASLRDEGDERHRPRSFLKGRHGPREEFDRKVAAWRATYLCGACPDARTCPHAYDAICHGECLAQIVTPNRGPVEAAPSSTGGSP